MHDIWKFGNKHRRNKTLNWLDSSDSKERWQSNMKKPNKRRILEELGFTKEYDIEYTFNEYGFRSDSFNKPCKLLSAGCSHTLGVGLAVEDTWSYKLAKHFNCNHHNVAISGSDLSQMCQRIYVWLPVLQPEILVVKSPPPFRFNWYNHNVEINSSGDDKKLSMDILNLVTQEENWHWQQLVHLKFLESFCADKCKLVVINHNFFLEQTDDNVARDLMHPGAKDHHATFEHILNKVSIVK